MLRQRGTTIKPIPNQAVNLVRSFEGFSPVIYICSAGIKTAGYGHALRKGEDERFKNGVTEEEAITILQQDTIQAASAVCRLITVALSENQYSALISFTFNLGGGALQRSTLRSCLNRGEYYESADELLKWIWGGGRKLPGLIRRRRMERNLFLSEM